MIIQVWLFKATKRSDGEGKQVPRMASLHQHFELGGASGKLVVKAFWLSTALPVISGVLLRSQSKGNTQRQRIEVAVSIARQLGPKTIEWLLKPSKWRLVIHLKVNNTHTVRIHEC